MIKTRAKDIMTTELIVGRETMTIEEAIQTLVNNHITGFPVVDTQNRLIGVLSELDIIHCVKKKGERSNVNLNKPIAFSRKVRSIKENTPFLKILKEFLENKVRRLPVVNTAGELTGIITRRDIMKVLYYRSKF